MANAAPRAAFLRVLLLASLVHAATSTEFIFPDSCARSQFSVVPDEFRCACADATKLTSWDFLTFHYCTMGGLPAVSIGLLSILLCLMFYAVADTTDRFMVPAVTYIAEATQMEPCVAGATLLAFANGMPDLISAVASFSGVSRHTGFGVGGLLGSGLVISCFTLGYLAYLSNGFPVTKRPFMRDVAFYLMALAGLVYVYRVGYVTVGASLSALALYASYTLSVVWMNNEGSSKKKSKMTEVPSDDDDVEGDDDDGPGTPPLEDDIIEPEIEPTDDLERATQPLHASSNDQLKPTKPTKGYIEVALHSTKATLAPIVMAADTPSVADPASLFDDETSSRTTSTSSMDLVDMPESATTTARSFAEYFDAITGWSAAGAAGRVLAVVVFPFTWARHVTVPTLNDDHSVNRVDVVACAFWIPLLYFGVLDRFVTHTVETLAVACVFSIVGAALAYRFASDAWYFGCAVLTLFVSATWVFVIGHEIVKALHVIGVSVGISGGTLGILVLAWGNSVGDFAGNVALVRQGQVQMATAACIAGPIFNTLVGGGFSLLLGCFQSTDRTVSLWSAADKSTLRSGFVVLGVCLVSLLMLCCLYTMRVAISKWFGLYLMVLYSIFCIVTLVDESGRTIVAFG
ncbi:Aste57867_15147 [Aphanomyces stellatus]|uniref:Aste57867_15147 protein n=1 Tax=Aphanomyces stellatus TaxID=120398 RepID=A0A485L2I0_9STRA|nr:hypothetical protein As57867_015091 [Aphanomyces stellatus]VFT91956.1 Aste57867_15147 [Aphanomyces stellatus]